MSRTRSRFPLPGARGVTSLALALAVAAFAFHSASVEADDVTPPSPRAQEAASPAGGTPQTPVAECRVSEPLPPGTLVMDRVVEALLANQAPESDGDAVVLNGRGYNYGPPPGVGIDPLLPRRAKPVGAAD